MHDARGGDPCKPLQRPTPTAHAPPVAQNNLRLLPVARGALPSALLLLPAALLLPTTHRALQRRSRVWGFCAPVWTLIVSSEGRESSSASLWTPMLPELHAAVSVACLGLWRPSNALGIANCLKSVADRQTSHRPLSLSLSRLAL